MDIGAKTVRHGRRVRLKVTTATFEALNFEMIWQKGGAAQILLGVKDVQRLRDNLEEVKCLQNGVNLAIY
ncbi:hypothetical protein EDC27_0094 [Desulfosoma caldarium]|uniref:Uncharacterized protein n=2 Tax=Desulfosoma caldarium TaxID=610254 RepID=A0A3N1VTB3_9BACT|nr:hypothetical protein EDC27_0094 [Desulfosoma caldarium]